MTLPPGELLALPDLSVQDLRDMGADGVAIDAIWRAARIIGEQNGTVGDYDHTVWGALQHAALRYRHMLARIDALTKEPDAAVALRDHMMDAVCFADDKYMAVVAERDSLRGEVEGLRNLLIESKYSIGGTWRERRDQILTTPQSEDDRIANSIIDCGPFTGVSEQSEDGEGGR
jgi:hypothetical protein